MSKLDLSVLRNILHYYCVRICRHWFFVTLLANLICLSLLTHYILVPFLAAGVPYFTKSLVPILKLEVRVQCNSALVKFIVVVYQEKSVSLEVHPGC